VIAELCVANMVLTLFILAQGLLPPDLTRKAVMEQFVPSQKEGTADR
jgi:hypothetical protein